MASQIGISITARTDPLDCQRQLRQTGSGAPSRPWPCPRPYRAKSRLEPSLASFTRRGAATAVTTRSGGPARLSRPLGQGRTVPTPTLAPQPARRLAATTSWPIREPADPWWNLQLWPEARQCPRAVGAFQGAPTGFGPASRALEHQGGCAASWRVRFRRPVPSASSWLVPAADRPAPITSISVHIADPIQFRCLPAPRRRATGRPATPRARRSLRGAQCSVRSPDCVLARKPSVPSVLPPVPS
jgi:hypothetical protein